MADIDVHVLLVDPTSFLCSPCVVAQALAFAGANGQIAAKALKPISARRLQPVFHSIKHNGDGAAHQLGFDVFKDTPVTQAVAAPVCTENLNPDVMVMQATEYPATNEPAVSLNRSMHWCIFIQ